LSKPWRGELRNSQNISFVLLYCYLRWIISNKQHKSTKRARDTIHIFFYYPFAALIVSLHSFVILLIHVHSFITVQLRSNNINISIMWRFNLQRFRFGTQSDVGISNHREIIEKQIHQLLWIPKRFNYMYSWNLYKSWSSNEKVNCCRNRWIHVYRSCIIWFWDMLKRVVVHNVSDWHQECICTKCVLHMDTKLRLFVYDDFNF
jgi:hypothetical protein